MYLNIFKPLPQMVWVTSSSLHLLLCISSLHGSSVPLRRMDCFPQNQVSVLGHSSGNKGGLIQKPINGHLKTKQQHPSDLLKSSSQDMDMHDVHIYLMEHVIYRFKSVFMSCDMFLHVTWSVHTPSHQVNPPISHAHRRLRRLRLLRSLAVAPLALERVPLSARRGRGRT